MTVYRYKLTDRHERWLSLIAPGDSLDVAWKILCDQYGPERVLEVKDAEDGGETPQRWKIS